MNVCVLITDGAPTREVDQLMPEVNANKDLGVRFITVGVTDQVTQFYTHYYDDDVAQYQDQYWTIGVAYWSKM